MAKIGEIVALKGSATAAAEGDVRELQVGSPVYEGDVLSTGAKSNVEIRFADDTVLSQGPDSEFTIDDYVFDAEQGEASEMFFSLATGTFRMVTGKIAEENPESVNVQSPLAVIGIRGTTTIHRINPDGTEQHGAEDLTGDHVLLMTDQFGNTRVVSFDAGGADFSPDAPMTQVRQFSPNEVQQFQQIVPLTTMGEPDPGEEGQDEGEGQGEGEAEGEGEGEGVGEGEGEGEGEDEGEGEGEGEGEAEGEGGEGEEGVPEGEIAALGEAEGEGPAEAAPEEDAPEGEGAEGAGSPDEGLEAPAAGGIDYEPYYLPADIGFNDNINPPVFPDGIPVAPTTGSPVLFLSPFDLGGDDTDEQFAGVAAAEEDAGADDEPIVEEETESSSGPTIDAPSGSQDEVDNTIKGTNGADVLNGTSQFDGIFGFGGDDTINGGDGEDYIDGGPGNDSIDGGSNTDPDDENIVSYWSASGPVTVDLSLGTNHASTPDGTDILLHIDDILGSRYDDTLSGNGAENGFIGGPGDDSIVGNGGEDWVAYRFADGGMTVDLSAGVSEPRNAGNASDGYDTFSGISNVEGSDYDDSLVGNASPNKFSPRGGSDTVVGGAGIDDVEYLDANSGVIVDLVNNEATGGAGGDSLSGIENVIGSDHNDTLIGDASDNVLIGQLGSDSLIGNGGADVFSFVERDSSNFDTIVDFVSNTDSIDFEGSAFTNLGGNGALTGNHYYEATAPTVTTGMGKTGAVIIYESDVGKLYYDPSANNNTAADATTVAVLSGAPGLLQTDIEIF